MDEWVDILDANAEKTGKSCLKSHAHKKGLLHASVHLWIVNEHQEILIQQRATSKETFPGLWDVSVAGHVASGESPEKAVVRETEEEIGLLIKPRDLVYIGTVNNKIEHHPSLIDHELHHVYYCQVNIETNSCTLQKTEVAAIRLVPLEQLRTDIIKNKGDFAPHGKDYYPWVLQSIKDTF
ncbi:MAG: NUDIX domain-containing protein [Lutibacter sp.]|nr:NUDIX domain-containing protein [Lutibacter sp.]